MTRALLYATIIMALPFGLWVVYGLILVEDLHTRLHRQERCR